MVWCKSSGACTLLPVLQNEMPYVISVRVFKTRVIN